jgi:hypothetical protein
MRQSLASNWSSVDEYLRAQVKGRRVSRRAQAWRAWARARVMWTRLKIQVLKPESMDLKLFVIKAKASLKPHTTWLHRYVVLVTISKNLNNRLISFQRSIQERLTEKQHFIVSSVRTNGSLYAKCNATRESSSNGQCPSFHSPLH